METSALFAAPGRKVNTQHNIISVAPKIAHTPNPKIWRLSRASLETFGTPKSHSPFRTKRNHDSTIFRPSATTASRTTLPAHVHVAVEHDPAMSVTVPLDVCNSSGPPAPGVDVAENVAVAHDRGLRTNRWCFGCLFDVSIVVRLLR